MISNKDMPAMPTPIIDNGCTAHGTEPTYGLTKREMFAMHAMQALATNSGYGAWEDMASDAVNIADALLEELERTK